MRKPLALLGLGLVGALTAGATPAPPATERPVVAPATSTQRHASTERQAAQQQAAAERKAPVQRLADDQRQVAATRHPCGEHVVADESDDGSTVCVAVGSDVSVMLTAAGDDSPWSWPTVTGHVLGPAMALPTPYGIVGWQFRTIAAGRAEITMTRPACPSRGKCHTVRYHLRVTVR